MARSVLLRQKFRLRRRRLASPGAIHFAGSLAIAGGAPSASIFVREKFLAAISGVEVNAVLSVAGLEKFSEYLTLMAPANLASVSAYEIADIYPGRIVIGDAAQGGILALTDKAAYGAAPSDAALFDVHIMESI